MPAVIVPAPRATFPSQTISAVALDPRHQATGTAARAVGVVRLRRRAGGAEDAEHLHLAGACVLEGVHEPRGQVHGRAAA